MEAGSQGLTVPARYGPKSHQVGPRKTRKAREAGDCRLSRSNRKHGPRQTAAAAPRLCANCALSRPLSWLAARNLKTRRGSVSTGRSKSSVRHRPLFVIIRGIGEIRGKTRRHRTFLRPLPFPASSAAGSRGYSKPSRSHLCSSVSIRGCSHAKRFGNAFGLQDHHIARGCTKLRRGKIRVPWRPFVVTPRLGGSAPCLPASHPFRRRDAALKKLRLQPCRAGDEPARRSP